MWLKWLPWRYIVRRVARAHDFLDPVSILSHLHRVGLPDYEEMPIVDPRGLVTPFMDSWSLDGWIVTEDGRSLIPSRLPSVSQRLCFDKGVAVITESSFVGLSLTSQVEVRLESQTPV